MFFGTHLNNNKYSVNKLSAILKKENLLIFQTNNYSAKEFKKLKPQFTKENLVTYKVDSKLAQKLINKSPLKNFLTLIEGPLILSTYDPNNNTGPELVKAVLNMSNKIVFLGGKNKKRFHSAVETNNTLFNYNDVQAKLNYISTIKKNPQGLCLLIKKRDSSR
jgi:tRNA G18 (ribose-2'-O)-methylase SpoU